MPLDLTTVTNFFKDTERRITNSSVANFYKKAPPTAEIVNYLNTLKNLPVESLEQVRQTYALQHGIQQPPQQSWS